MDTDQSRLNQLSGGERRPVAVAFGVFRIDTATKTLLRNGKRVRIQRKPRAVLAYLAREAPRLVTREELLERFWSRSVNEEALTRCVSTIRKHLDDTGDPPRFIETHRGEGYRFIAPVTRTGTPSARSVPTGTGTSAEADTQPSSLRRRWLSLAAVAAAIAAAMLLMRSPDRGEPQLAAEVIDRISVLPIVAASGEDARLAPALTDQLMRAVSRIEGITVVSSGPHQAGMLDPRALGETLNVQALLVGRVETGAKGPRLSARLVSTRNGGLLWSSNLDPGASAVAVDQVEVLARSVAARLRPTLQLQELPPPVDAGAYREYLHGRYYWSQRSLIGLNAAIGAFDRALEIEPGYVDALVGSAESWLLLPLYGAMPPSEAIPRARDLANLALREDAGEARARAVLGVIAMQFDWDWDTAEELLREAVTLNPNNATAQQWLGELYCYRLRAEVCRRQLETALELDPLSPLLNLMQGSPALWARQYEAAVEYYTAALEETPDFPFGMYFLGLAHAGLGEWTAALDAYEAALPALGLVIVGGPMIHARAKLGDLVSARSTLAELEALAVARYVPPSKLAVAYLGLGETQQAMEWLTRAVDSRDDRLVYLAVDVHYRELHDDPVFRAIAERVGLLSVLDRR